MIQGKWCCFCIYIFFIIFAYPFYLHAEELNSLLTIQNQKTKIIETPSQTKPRNELEIKSEKHISLNFKKISLRALLQSLAELSGQNIVVSNSVTGETSINLQNITFNKAFKVILESEGLGVHEIEGALIVAPLEEIAAKQKNSLLAKQQIFNIEPLQSELIFINHSKAADIAALLKNPKNTLLSSRGSINFDARTNTLWVQDIAEKIKEIRFFIKQLDIPVRQVLIEARVVSIDKAFEHEIGVRFGLSKPIYVGHSEVTSKLDSDKNTAIRQPLNYLNVDLPAANLSPIGGSANFALALAKLGNGILLDLELSALESEGCAKIIANPRLVTANQKEAIIEAGEEIPYQQTTASGATSVAFKKAVLSLKVTPQITPDKRIIMDLTVSQDKRGPEVVLGVPSIDKREITTQVLVNDGQTLVLGGIYQKMNSSGIQRVPFLGNLPFLGALFRRVSTKEEQRELVIFVTPRIIEHPEWS